LRDLCINLLQRHAGFWIGIDLGVSAQRLAEPAILVVKHGWKRVQ
jgi:hypothetical protein